LALAIAITMRLPTLVERVGGEAQTSPVPVPPSISAKLALPPLDQIMPGAGPAAPPTEPVARAARVTAAAPLAEGVEALDALATELRQHQAALATREQAIELREAVVQAVEARVRAQVAKLEQFKGELEKLLAQVSADQQARIAQLIKVYEAMKAKNAAAIFDPMALELLLPIVRGMRETKVAAIVAEMDPAKARALTAELARERPLPALP
jgi:flagellar motility protein MotE (MotC chaperone)